jgi:hypothetical protein
MPQEVEALMKICGVSGKGGMIMQEIQGAINSWVCHQTTSSAMLEGILCFTKVEVAWEKEAERW